MPREINWRTGLASRFKRYEEGVKKAMAELILHHLNRRLDDMRDLLEYVDKTDGDIFCSIKRKIEFIKKEIKENR